MSFFERNRQGISSRGLDASRLPPGQYLTDRFPVLHVGEIPDYQPGQWSLDIFGLVDKPFTLTLDELKALPSVSLTFDIHCVTKWSKFDTTWQGVRVKDLLALAGKVAGDGVSAFELLGGQGFKFLAEVGPEVKMPFDAVPEWSVLIDLGLAEGQDPLAVLTTLFEVAVEADLVTDGVIAQSEAQRRALWMIRESIPEANRRIGSVSSHDISVPLSVIPEFIARGKTALAALGDFRINCFGHLGDGNLHYNVFPPTGKTRADYEHLRSDVKAIVHDLAHELEGSVSAEHGIGRLKVNDLQHYGDPVKLTMMRAVKDALDPQGIMNPGAVLPPAGV